jgi:hypothetical protein
MSKIKFSHTRLKDHQRLGSKLRPPLASLQGGINFSSWIDERLPDVLWQAIVRSAVPQEQALAIFRKVASSFSYDKTDSAPFPTHSLLSTLTDEQFDLSLAPVLEDATLIRHLGALLLFESLPDRHHWLRHTKQSDSSFETLARSVTTCFDHQSQEATDIRWFTILCILRKGRITFGLGEERNAEKLRELLEYPDYGDQHFVRPSIRAMEIMFRKDESGRSTAWCKAFWDECFAKTNCFPGERFRREQENKVVDFDPTRMLTRIEEIYGELSLHFDETQSGSSIDSKHDAAFGFTFYGLYLAYEALATEAYRRAIGHVVVRVISELVIALGWLLAKDEKGLWDKYRRHGTGQIKLNLLKMLERDDLPAFLDLKFYEMLINEDYWHEYLEIDIGHFAGTDLRKMSEQAGLKEIYDKYYSTTSPFVHGSWGAVRMVTFDSCLNPLHRFHRIPAPPNMLFDPAFVDLKKLMNVMLDMLEKAYPAFKLRISDEDLPIATKRDSGVADG